MKQAKLLLSTKHICSEVSEGDSRGPGWYCCAENCWNPETEQRCRWCGHKDCRKEEEDARKT